MLLCAYSLAFGARTSIFRFSEFGKEAPKGFQRVQAHGGAYGPPVWASRTVRTCWGTNLAG